MVLEQLAYIPLNQKFGHETRSISGLVASCKKLGNIKFFFYFSGQCYEVKLYKVPGYNSLILSHLVIEAAGIRDLPEDTNKKLTELADGFWICQLKSG